MASATERVERALRRQARRDTARARQRALRLTRDDIENLSMARCAGLIHH